MKSFAMLFVSLSAFIGLARPANAQGPSVDVHVTVLGQMGTVSGSSSDHLLTFSGPVEVPGVALSRGSYIFRFIAPSVLQVLSENRSVVYATFFVTPISRSDVTDGYEVTLRKIENDAPVRITALFLPAASTGYEVTYPKAQS